MPSTAEIVSNNNNNSGLDGKDNNNSNNNSTSAVEDKIDTSQYILHQKHVNLINRSKLYNLKNANPQIRENMVKMHRYLHDVAMYEQHMPKRSANGCPFSHVRKDFLDTLLQYGNIREVRRCEVRGYVKFFTIPEHFKKRFRPIRHTYEVNEVFGKETLVGNKYPGKSVTCNLPLKGTHFAAFDMAAYYDQFGMENGISNFLCCRGVDGKFYAANRLAMGQRQSCDIGQTTTLFLMDFPERRCRTGEAVIDNAVFVGSYEDVLHDSIIYVQRCREAGITLNEFEIIEKEGIEACIQQTGEWCGVALDFINKSVNLTKKTLDKIELSWGNRDNWTNRQFSAHIGLLFWTWGILDIPIHNYYPLLKHISETSRKLQEDESLWDSPAIVQKFALPSLEEWTLLALKNNPRLLKQSSDPKWFLCTDASAHGWGYVALNQETGEIRFFGAKWTRQQLVKIFSRNGTHKIKKSVYSEPLAIYFSLCHFLKDGEKVKIEFAEEFKNELKMKIRVATDNVSAQQTMNRGFASRSFDINEAIKKLREAFPLSDFEFEFCFVPGWCNPADPFSRGKFGNNVNAKDGHKDVDINKLRRDMGDVRVSTVKAGSTCHAVSTG
jgi:hypothetical protein